MTVEYDEVKVNADLIVSTITDKTTYQTRKVDDKKIYFIYKPSLDDIESLLVNTKTLIACHGAITHVANSYGVQILDIIDESKKDWYPRFSSYMSNNVHPSNLLPFISLL